MRMVILKAPFIQFVGEGFYETEHGSQRHNILGVPRSEIEDEDTTTIHDIDPDEPDPWAIDL